MVWTFFSLEMFISFKMCVNMVFLVMRIACSRYCRFSSGRLLKGKTSFPSSLSITTRWDEFRNHGKEIYSSFISSCIIYCADFCLSGTADTSERSWHNLFKRRITAKWSCWSQACEVADVKKMLHESRKQPHCVFIYLIALFQRAVRLFGNTLVYRTTWFPFLDYVPIRI